MTSAGLLEDWDFWIRIFPNSKELFVRCLCPDAGGIGIRSLGSVRFQNACSSKSEIG